MHYNYNVHAGALHYWGGVSSPALSNESIFLICSPIALCNLNCNSSYSICAPPSGNRDDSMSGERRRSPLPFMGNLSGCTCIWYLWAAIVSQWDTSCLDHSLGSGGGEEGKGRGEEGRGGEGEKWVGRGERRSLRISFPFPPQHPPSQDTRSIHTNTIGQ